MKKSLRYFTLMCLLFGVSNLFAQKNVLYVSGSGPSATANPSDTLCIYYLTKSGYTVTHIDDNTSAANIATDTVGKNVIVISSTVASGNINHVGYAWSPMPIINWENAADDEYGISLSNNCTDSAIVIASNTHPMLTGLPVGNVFLTYGDLALSYCQPVNPVNSLATFYNQSTNAVPKSALGLWEIGDDLDPQYASKAGYPASGKTVGRRCHVPFQNGSFNKITPEGLALFLNSVDYMIDKKMDATVPVVKLAVDVAALNVEVGKEVQKSAIVFPSNATDKAVTWASSNTAVATVSATGVVKGITEGTATITATSANGTKTTLAVTVTLPTIEVTSVTLDITSKTLNVGETVTITATVVPADATNKTITWSSSNTSVATVSAAGLVTAKSGGTATITATSNNGKTATAAITVNVPVVEVTSVTLDITAKSLVVGGTVTITATVLPANATNKTVTWSSSNSAVATVSAAGLVTAISAGTATITATSNNSKTATAAITVTLPVVEVTSITLDITAKTLNVNETVTITATVLPANATNKTVIWTSSNIEVATVSAAGLVTAKKSGSATITATSNNAKTATAVITVTPPTGVSEISLADFSVYPNPVKNTLMINAADINLVTVYNANGSQVMKLKKGFENGINVSGLTAGIYVINISTGKGVATRKFVKE